MMVVLLESVKAMLRLENVLHPAVGLLLCWRKRFFAFSPSFERLLGAIMEVGLRLEVSPLSEPALEAWRCRRVKSVASPPTLFAFACFVSYALR